MGISVLMTAGKAWAQFDNDPFNGASPFNGWLYECIDPEQGTNAYSPPPQLFIRRLGNRIVQWRLGIAGTVTYGGGPGPCYPSARTNESPGRMSFGAGADGSLQDTFDDDMAFTVGFPEDAAGDYAFARIQTQLAAEDAAESEVFGEGGLAGSFVLSSNRVIVALWNQAGRVAVRLQSRVIGDAVRLQWDLTNLAEEPNTMGVLFGAYTGMMTTGQGDDKVDPGSRVFPADNVTTDWRQFGSNLITRRGPGVRKRTAEGYRMYVDTGTTKPLRTEKNFIRSNPTFPSTVYFQAGQSAPYGLRIDNVPGENDDFTAANQIIIGNHAVEVSEGTGVLRNYNMPQRLLGDLNPGDPLETGLVLEDNDIALNEIAFAQRLVPETRAPGGTYRVVQYIRSPWGIADYRDPYTALVDAPTAIGTQTGGTNGLAVNPFRIVAYLDNQYAQTDREVDLRDVRVTLNLPTDGSLRLVADPNDPNATVPTRTQIIPTIAANQIEAVEWWVEATGDVTGKVDYSVNFQPIPGPAKTLPGSITIAATPRIRLGEGPNLISLPWSFPDSSLDDITGLQGGLDYVAYTWDPDQGGYTLATTAERGRAFWIVPNNDLGFLTLTNAVAPSDTFQGGSFTTLRPGWNMIANPYSVGVPLKDLVAVAEEQNQEAFTWAQLIENGFVSSSLAFWDRLPSDPSSGSYRFTENSADVLLPQRGYWIFVNTFRPLRIVWPPVLLKNLPYSGRAASEWRQTDKRWRLQLSARQGSMLDHQNFVGIASNSTDARILRMPEPPQAPQGSLQLAIEGQTANGQPQMLSRSFAERAGRQEWKVSVTSPESGEVTLNWPNINSVPRNVRLRLTDLATQTVRDLRVSNNYTFRMDQPGTREFKLQMEPGGASKAVIGNVVVSRPSRDRNAPFTISYSLSAEATTSIRVLSGAGKEVFTITRGRADRVGENTAVWAMRDNANRAVAPGSYRVEILAETPSGERVRKIVPVNVVR